MPRRFSVLATIALACALLLPLEARSPGTITGTVTLTAVRSAPSSTSVYGRRGVAPKTAAVGPETRKVVVHLAGSTPAQAVPPMRASIVQRGEQFVPPVTVVTTGSTVDFPNGDPYFHNVFSLSRTGTFDLGRYPSGSTRAHVFARPGIVKVFCHIHSQMSALVVVLDHPYFAIPSESGAFTLPPVPEGDYTLVAWHERVGAQRQRISVGAGAATRVHVTLPVLEAER